MVKGEEILQAPYVKVIAIDDSIPPYGSCRKMPVWYTGDIGFPYKHTALLLSRAVIILTPSPN
jgi:hypothetical protein